MYETLHRRPASDRQLRPDNRGHHPGHASIERTKEQGRCGRDALTEGVKASIARHIGPWILSVRVQRAVHGCRSARQSPETRSIHIDFPQPVLAGINSSSTTELVIVDQE